MGDVFSSVCTFCVPLWPEASLSMQLGLPPKAVFLVAVLRLFRSCGVYLVLAVLCCAVSWAGTEAGRSRVRDTMSGNFKFT
jgi:hypothetical protein